MDKTYHHIALSFTELISIAFMLLSLTAKKSTFLLIQTTEMHKSLFQQCQSSFKLSKRPGNGT